MAATKRREYPAIHPHDRAAFRAWLAEHHATAGPTWVIFDKKHARADRLAYADAVEEALCFGWIDSVINAVDHARYRQLFSPRKPASEWSKLNKTRVAALLKAGLMMPAGKAAIAVAKKNGAWTKIDHVESLVVPDDLTAALARSAKARENFARTAPSVKKMYLHRINSAVRPETRRARIAQVLAWAKSGVRPTSMASSAKPKPSAPRPSRDST